jgi:hypothetical protein
MFDASLHLLIRHFHRNLTAADGILVVSSSAIEGECIEAGRKWFEESNQRVWVVGPLENTPPASTTIIPGSEVPQHAAEDARILSFLDDMNKKHGSRSVIYVSSYICS